MKRDLDAYIRKAQSPEVASATLPIVNERDLVAIVGEPKIIPYRGRLWRPPEGSRGLLHVPLTPMALIKSVEFEHPTPKSLGVIARVEGRTPNGVARLHMLADPGNFDPYKKLRSAARRNIRVAVDRGTRIERVTPQDVGLLLRDGPQVWSNSATGLGRATDRESYKRDIRKFVSENTLVLAATVKGKLAGYLFGEAVREERTAYLRQLILTRDPEILSTNVGSLLVYTFIQACTRTSGIDRVVNSKQRHEGLTIYKRDMGFPLEEVPVVVKLRPGFALAMAVVRKVKPELYFKIYGRY